MSRLQKKCVLAAAGFHLLLFLVLLVGPAFLAPKQETIDLPLLDFVPVKTVDALVSGGGNPKGQPPPPATHPATPPKPPAQPERRARPEPEPPKARPERESSEVSMERRRKPQVSTKLIRPGPSAAERRAAEERRRQAADARRQAATAITQAASAISSGLAPGTTIELKGPGGGGVPYANWCQAVKKLYTDAWIVPDGISDDSATTTVSITFARDGTVISKKIIGHSGNAAVDLTVQMTLDRVTRAPALPDEAKENQRTITIKFNLKAKLIG